MNILKKSIQIAVLSALITVGCADEKRSQSADIINPNGDSQLALIMRDMFDQHMAVKKQLVSEDRSVDDIKIGDIYTLDATEPEKVKSKEYKAYGESYLAILNELNNAPESKVTELHNAAVESCMNCHTALCPGPRVKIKKLFVKNEK